MKKFLFVLFFYLFGCSKTEMTPVGHNYQTHIQNLKITLFFQKDGRFFGKAFNSYFGIYQIDGKGIQLNLQGSSMKLGTKLQMETEENYFKQLKGIKNFSLSDKGIVLKGENIEFEFNNLDTDEMNIH